MNDHKPIPPKLAERFLLWFIRNDLAEEVLGDLDEKFYQTFEKKSAYRARLNYWYQVISYLRPFAIRKSRSINSNYIFMIRHNFLITFRGFKRYKASFFINMIGLSTGLVCALLIYLWVNDELTVDKFHEKDDRLYQVMQNFESSFGINTIEWTPAPLAKTLMDEMPEVEYAVPVYPPASYTFNSVVAIDNKRLKARAKYAGKDYFNVFSYRLIHGDRDQVLHDKNSVVISDELALNLFRTTENIVGKTITWEQGEFAGDYAISGVFEKIPANSSIQFDMVFNYELYTSKHLELQNWSYNDPCTYIILRDDARAEVLSNKVADLTKTHDPNAEGSLFLRKYSDQHLYGNYENGVNTGGRIAYVILFSVIAIFILLIACINFMNLSTARASRRFKEIGIKKSIGAKRSTLAVQYLGESLIMAFLSLIAALLIVQFLLPQFNQITGKQLALGLDSSLLLSLCCITLVTGLLAGSYPALHLSGFHPIKILKGNASTSSASLWVRKGLVVFQFTASVILIILVLVVSNQMAFIQSKNLGYEKDNVVYFNADSWNSGELETFLNEVSTVRGVINASAMKGNLTVNDHNSTAGITWEGQLAGEEVKFTDLVVDFDFFETMGIEVASGRTFSRNFSTEDSKIIFNEAAVKSMGLIDPVGQSVKLWGRERQIIGVVKDFHFESLYESVKPCFFRLGDKSMNILIKIKAGTAIETIAEIQDLYQKKSQGMALDYQFLDEAFQRLYASEQRVSILSRYFAGIAIIISCLGLFGLAAFTAERRLKEIGVRKVMGAGELSIITLLSNDFTKIVFIAISIALPVAYLLAKNWLEAFAHRIDLEWWFFIGAGALALIIAWLTVSIQTIKAARLNPVICLKDE
ncbi:ABC transporter permease [Fulvivirgaceae bacterium BMA10]|uniref:ABC transporter permease n=1 Tax=Splendidivirga corallicola TaxID=3051826 RepID=A0ABT8KKN4_9BACT|nr:ABC transporter permease [Fulvivirgaceae bacterium BMA10]